MTCYQQHFEINSQVCTENNHKEFNDLQPVCLLDWVALQKSKHVLGKGSVLLPLQRSFFENRLEGSVLFISMQETVSQSTDRFDDLIKLRAKCDEDYSHLLGLIHLLDLKK